MTTSPDTPRSDAAAERVGGCLSWVRTIGLSVLVALTLRLVAFDAYRIPSTSMEDTLLAGDYVFVSKLGYGARLPRLFGGPTARVPGLGSVHRGDVIVFNHPPEAGPVERRTPFIKRVIGLPGDTLRIVAKRVVIGQVTLATPPEARRLWRVRYRELDGIADSTLLALGMRARGGHDRERLVEGTEAESVRLAALDGVERVEAYVRPPGDGSAHFPPSPSYSLDDYGPVVVPRRGMRVALDDATWLLYGASIAREAAAYGLPAPDRTVEGYVIEGAPATAYTFRDDHLFVMGDNRDDSDDSRSWGFVPQTYVIGRAARIYFSWDAAAGRVRWPRVLRRIS